MYLDDLKIGMEIDLPEVVITGEQIKEFSRLYDPHPMHWDEEYAKTTKFGRPIAPGVLSFMAVWSKFMAGDFYGKELIGGKSTKIEWFSPVFAEDVLKGKVKVTNITRRNDYNGIVEIAVDVRNQRGELVLTNVTEAVVKYRK